MKTKIPFIITIIISFFSCNQRQEQIRPTLFAPKVVKAEGHIVSKESMATPKSIPAGKPKVIIAGKPKVVPFKTNIHLAGIPKTVIAGTPKICTPGKDSFTLPKKVPAINKPFLAGIPEMVIAPDAVSKEHNPQNFSSFNKQHGLKADAVLCMLQDRNGNIWFGTWEGGVSRYDGKYFAHLTQKEGLSSNNVWSIYEDKAGNLWFGTVFGGVSKYDGKTFTNFTEGEGLVENAVNCILEDRSGYMWFGTEIGGVFRLDRDGKTFKHYTEKEGLINNKVLGILEDGLGNIWFGTRGGISKYDGTNFNNLTEKEGLSNNWVNSIFRDKSGNLWFGTAGGGVSRLDRDGKTFTHFTEKEGLGNNSVLSILQDKFGNLWFGTWGGGVSRYDGKYFTHFTEEDGLANNTVKCILEDSSGGLWFGTDGGGVSKYNGRIFTHFTSKEGLRNGGGGIFEDRSGNLWFGGSEYDGESFANFTQEEGPGNAGSILQDRSGNLWFGCHFGGIFKYDGRSFTHFTPNEGLCSDEVTQILQDRSGSLWVTTGGTANGICRLDRDGKTFTHYTDKEGLSDNNVWCMREDRSGNLWFGTNRGVSRLGWDGNTFTHFTVKEGLSGNKVSCVFEDKSGSLWFGTDGGVSRLDRDGETFTHFTEKEGLSNDDVSSIFEDRAGNIWIGTSVGLNKLSAKSLLQLSANNSTVAALFKSYTYEDGLLGTGCYAIFEDKNGTIWISTSDRLTAYHPEGDKPDTIPPNIQLTGIALFNEKIPWVNLEQKKDTSLVLGNGVSVGHFKFDSLSRWYNVPEHLSLNYKNNYLTFNFIGIATKSSHQVKYQYKLEGLDENWSALTTRTEASYGNLLPSNYTFKIRAMNSDGYWSSAFNYSFTIRPPWWQTWWFRITASIFVIAVIYGLMRWRLQQKFRVQLERSEKETQLAQLKLETAELQQQKTELEMQALRAQMNPHFIFNSLNSINRFILQNNRAQASEYLTKFSKLVRMILQNSQASLISLESELEALQLYLEMEALRFNYHFNYKISFPKNLDIEILKVPPLIIQPYVENAIWHGLMHKEEKGQLDIEVLQENNHLFFKITDDGIGRKKAAELASKSATKHKSMGLRITADRIAMMQSTNGNESPVTINDLVNVDGSAAGTEVTIKMPVIDN